MFKAAVRVAGATARVVRPVRQSLRRVATGAGETVRTSPSAEELQRTQGFLRLVDDRLAEKLGEIASGMRRMEGQIGKMEGQIGKLESKMEGQIGKLESKMEGQIGKLESRMEAQIGKLESRMEARIGKLESRMDGRIGKIEKRLDEFVTKEEMGAAFQHMETQFKNYLLMGTGSVVVTGAMLAVRAGFFSSPAVVKVADVSAQDLAEPAKPMTPAPA